MYNSPPLLSFPISRASVVVPCLGRLVGFSCKTALVGGLLESLVVRLALLGVELLLEVAGCGFVCACLGSVSAVMVATCAALCLLSPSKEEL